MSSKSRPWLIKNAVMAWLHNYAELEKGELTKDYQALYNQLDAEYGELINEQPTTTETRKRGRAAKRARPKKASSDTPSTEENETTNQET